MIFYKATRPNGRDFYTDTVDYAGALVSGKPIKRLPKVEHFRTCSDTVYHAGNEPAETLIGGSWPCRLFEVTGKPVANDGRHKFGFRSMRVVREIEAWRALGPNGEAVVAHIEQIKSLSLDQINALAAAWGAAWGAARGVAWGAARVVAWGAARGAAWDAASAAARDAARGAAWSAARDAARGAAGDAAGGAALAIMTPDLITEDEFRTLIGPWKVVVG